MSPQSLVEYGPWSTESDEEFNCTIGRTLQGEWYSRSVRHSRFHNKSCNRFSFNEIFVCIPLIDRLTCPKVYNAIVSKQIFKKVIRNKSSCKASTTNSSYTNSPRIKREGGHSVHRQSTHGLTDILSSNGKGVIKQ